MVTGNPGNNRNAISHTLSIVAFINAILWICSIIALIIILQNSPSVKGLSVILTAGLGNALAIISIVMKQRQRSDGKSG